MERRRNTVRGADDGDAVPSSQYPTSALLLAAVNRGDARAIKELFVLYAPLLRDQARSMNVPPDERDEVVTTVLDDVVLHLMEHQLMPRHLARYLVAALRNRVRNRHRNAEHRLSTYDRASLQLAGGSERIVAECHSDYGLRTAMSDDAEASPPLSAVIIRRHMPLRDIAEQLGISYGAARVRLHRLRARFARLATQYVETLKADERREIERFFRRAQVNLSDRSGARSGQHLGTAHDGQSREKTNGQN